MRGPSRATARAAWVGRPVRERPIDRPCPRCPAERNGRCLEWVAEKCTTGSEVFQGEGRWKTLTGFHWGRKSPGSKYSLPVLAYIVRPCVSTEPHGFHEHNTPAVWCRGAL